MQHNSLGQFTALEPDLSMTDDLAYIIGVYFGDAFIEKQDLKKQYGLGYSVKLEVIDQDFRDAFAGALKNIGLHPTLYIRIRKSGRYVGHLSYCVKARSIRLYKYLAPLSTVSLNRLLIEPAHKKAFLKGFFDSEGSSSRGRVSLVNTDYSLMLYVAKTLLECGIDLKFEGKRNYRPNWLPIYTIRIPARCRAQFGKTVGSSIARKAVNLVAEKRKKYSQEVIAKALALVDTGYGYTSVARKLGISRWTVGEWYRNYKKGGRFF